MTNDDIKYLEGQYDGLIKFSQHMRALAEEFKGTRSAGFCTDCAVKAESFANDLTKKVLP